MEDFHMSKYQIAKARARDRAVEWQSGFCDQNYSYGELVYWQRYFERLAKRYGLVEEFKENGII
jgi:hypothetical protein